MSQISREHYSDWVRDIKSRISQAQIQAAKTVSSELILLYWDIGRSIVDKQDALGWGKSVVEELAKDLSQDFHGTSGFSPRNLWDMRRFYLEYRDRQDLRQLVAEIPWGHNLLLINQVKDLTARLYYLEQTRLCAWSRNVLLHQIKNQAYERHQLADKQHSFAKALPEHLVEQAHETMKDVYMLDFLGLTGPVLERELESKMVSQIRDVLLELGRGFTFIGNQYRLVLNQKEYFLDLLFYHRPLQCLVAVELKVGEFKPEYAGKMNFYLSLLDDTVRLPHENPSIGLILCTSRDRVEVEYSLRNQMTPIGVSEYRLTHELPDALIRYLPSVDELEKHLIEHLNESKIQERSGEEGKS